MAFVSKYMVGAAGDYCIIFCAIRNWIFIYRQLIHLHSTLVDVICCLSFCCRIDKDRIAKVGADQACAEWLVKCGATVRFHGRKNIIDDYNKLGAQATPNAKLAEVHAEEATVMSIGFLHFSK